MEFWVQRLHEALDQVIDGMGDKLKDDFDADKEDLGWPDASKEELVRDQLEGMEFWIDGRLSGFDALTLRRGTSSVDVPRGAGSHAFIFEDG